MLDTLKSLFSNLYYDDYEVSGLTPLSVDDCIWHLEKMKFYVDDKLNFYQLFEKSHVEIIGYLAPRTEQETLICVDVEVKIQFKFGTGSALFVICLLEILVFAFMTSLQAVAFMFIIPVGILAILIGERWTKYRRARAKVERATEHLHRRFKLEEIPPA